MIESKQIRVEGSRPAMSMKSVKRDVCEKRSGERGNVLFLILIAVALFAALSYAVTSSSRSGSKDQGREKNVIGGAEITQYPAGLRTAILRMIIAGVANDELYFDTPAVFGAGLAIDDTDGDETDETRAVFHPAGGGAAYQVANPELMSTGAQQAWIFSGDYSVNRIGITANAATGSDLIAFLPNVTRSVCLRINEQLGITVTVDANGDGIPAGGTNLGVPVVGDNMTEANPGYSYVADHRIGTIPGGPDFAGQPYGCYDADDGNGPTSAQPYVYYHVLVER